MTDEARGEVMDQLRRVIAWEVEAQTGVQRRVEDMPPLIADTLLDYFDITLKPGADVSGFDYRRTLLLRSARPVLPRSGCGRVGRTGVPAIAG